MPHTVTVLRVFVASTEEVAEEGLAIELAVNEVNRLAGSRAGIRLEPVSWRTHARPGFGADAQDVINEQIGDDYDIFIGVLWSRLGTPTPRAESGTAEEFQRALDRFRTDPSKLSIMMYFKNAPIAPDSVDVKQLEAVRNFQRLVSDRGGLHGSFKTAEEFGTQLRVHLSEELREWEKRLTGGNQTARREIAPTPLGAADAGSQGAVGSEDDEVGFLDLMQIQEQQFGDAGNAVLKINAAMKDMTAQIGKRTLELGEARGDIRAAHRVSARIADDMNAFAARVNAEVPIVARGTREGIDAVGQMVSLVAPLGSEGRASVRSLLPTLKTLAGTMKGCSQATRGMRETVSRLPRASRVLNNARRAVVQCLDSFLGEVDSGAEQIGTIVASIERLPEN